MMIKKILEYTTVKEIMKHYKVSRATAHRWLRQGYAVLREYPATMPQGLSTDTLRIIARRSAKYVAARQGDSDLIAECEQQALIEMWKDADAIGGDQSRAYKAGRFGALKALRAWRHRIPVDLALSTRDMGGMFPDDDGPDYTDPDESWMVPQLDSPSD